jgi:hypothetical protein
MELNNIINNNDYKIIFLKAILLGINYGESNNVNYYKEALQKELLKINKKNLEIESEINSEKIIENNIFIQKYKNILINLENQRLYVVNLIQTLSSAHYGYNYSKINLLKNNLALIMKEIEKNKLIIKNKERSLTDNPKKNIFGQVVDNKNNVVNISKQNLKNSNEKNIIKSVNLKNNNYTKMNNMQYFAKNIPNNILFNEANIKQIFETKNNIIPDYIPDDIITDDTQNMLVSEHDNIKKDNLVGELEKTLDNLSNLMIK